VVAALILALGATAAASGLFAAAPPDVIRIFKNLPRKSGEGIDSANVYQPCGAETLTWQSVQRPCEQ
jgi:hypothetical protein